ncbi:MAG: hypothetical protein ABEJ93_03560 [Candidatus Nanohalobium sp.]
MPEEIDFEDLSEGMKLLFNDRKAPLTVKQVGEEALVEGPGGGEYIIYKDGEALLVARKGNKRYSSYCEDLREVGEWQRQNHTWTHTDTGAKVTVEKKDNGFYTIKSEGLEEDIGTPKYGFTNREKAVEEAEKFIEKHREGL